MSKNSVVQSGITDFKEEKFQCTEHGHKPHFVEQTTFKANGQHICIVKDGDKYEANVGYDLGTRGSLETIKDYLRGRFRR